MNRSAWTILGIAVLAALGAYFYFQPTPGPQLETPPSAPVPAAPPAPAAPPPEEHYELPAPPAPAGPPLTLDNSDTVVRPELQQLLGEAGAWLTPKNLVRRIVATVDSLDRAPISLRLRAIGAVPGHLVVDGAGGSAALSPENAARYALLIDALRATDGGRIAAVYRSHYALFQQAYEDLGYPKHYFNDRLVRIIDHLLATPEVQYPVPLVQTGTIYQYADPDLEARSSGQKLLIRMGAEDAALVKTRLRELRRTITTR